MLLALRIKLNTQETYLYIEANEYVWCHPVNESAFLIPKQIDVPLAIEQEKILQYGLQ